MLSDLMLKARESTGRNLAMPAQNGRIALVEFHEEDGDPFARREMIVNFTDNPNEIASHLRDVTKEA